MPLIAQVFSNLCVSQFPTNKFTLFRDCSGTNFIPKSTFKQMLKLLSLSRQNEEDNNINSHYFYQSKQKNLMLLTRIIRHFSYTWNRVTSSNK